MRLSAYAKHMGVTYKTAFRWWKAGKLDAYQLDTGTIIVRESATVQDTKQVALYARVSSADQKGDLERQMQRFADDDTHVDLLIANPHLSKGKTVSTSVETTQIAPTILRLLGLNPRALQAVQLEHTQVLPDLDR